MRDYIVWFDTYRNHIATHWRVCVEAKNAKEAIAIARATWNRPAHQFHLRAERGTATREFRAIECFRYPVW